MPGNQNIFQENLSLLRKRNPLLADALAETDSSDIEEVVGPRGTTTLREKGVLLGSAYDPIREAERMAETMSAEPADVMIAIGFGLGVHFPFYCKQNPGTVIVYEPSVSRLYAALQLFSLTRLFAENRDFIITANLEQFSQFLDARYLPSLRIQVFPHPALLRIDPAAIAEVVERTRRVKDAADTDKITTIERMIPWSKVIAGNGFRIASSASFGALAGLFKDKPAVVVAAGPSLDKQLERLKSRSEDVLIIAIGQTVKALAAAGIKPHLVHILESRNVAHQLTDEGSDLKQNIVLSPDCHPAIYDVPVATTFVATPSVNPMGRWIEDVRGNPCLTIGGGTVALGAVGLAQVLGANPVMLIGQDLAFTDGRAYAKNSAYEFVGVKLSDNGKCEFTNRRRKNELLGDKNFDTGPETFAPSEVVWVEGWAEGERVPTWRAYASFIEQYREIGLYFRQLGIRLVNCTEGGARIPRVEHVAFQEILDELPVEPLDAFERIEDAYMNAPKHTQEDFRPAVESARKALVRIDSTARKAIEFIRNAEKNADLTRSDQNTLDILRRLGRYDKKLRKQLARVPWFDALVQPEIYTIMAAVRRTERIDPTADGVSAESQFLFQAVRDGAVRAREWFDEFDASFDSSSEAEEPVVAKAEKKEYATPKGASVLPCPNPGP